MKHCTSGTLYVVATPIGNLGDISARALQVLNDVDVIACEDTRHSAHLLQHFGISTKTIACHDHNERNVSAAIVGLLREGKSVALISDAGTPLISDPGYILLREVHQAGLKVCPIAGVSALIAALSVAGLATDRFVFEGFLPAKVAARRARLQQLVNETRTLIFYESSHRILASLDDLIDVFGADRDATMAREMTKKFETIHSANLAQLQTFIEVDSNQQKGEFVLVVAGSKPTTDKADAERILIILLAELPVKQAAALTSKLTGVSKNELYQLALTLRQSMGTLSGDG
ncbi:MAG: 16S rRNA (cytidine(1402)-2'-O)-methyltransferase [Gammaproteobacteria bacterium]|nr:16S rRNA (cytidine(1402)-2'-O)-methyltransferase [Gammaproteobacteria bacterium]